MPVEHVVHMCPHGVSELAGLPLDMKHLASFGAGHDEQEVALTLGYLHRKGEAIWSGAALDGRGGARLAQDDVIGGDGHGLVANCGDGHISSVAGVRQRDPALQNEVWRCRNDEKRLEPSLKGVRRPFVDALDPSALIGAQAIVCSRGPLDSFEVDPDLPHVEQAAVFIELSERIEGGAGGGVGVDGDHGSGAAVMPFEFIDPARKRVHAPPCDKDG